jgi:hypothetical protein
VLLEGGTIIHKGFEETRDSKILNLTDPDKLKYIDEVRSLLNITIKQDLIGN